MVYREPISRIIQVERQTGSFSDRWFVSLLFISFKKRNLVFIFSLYVPIKENLEHKKIYSYHQPLSFLNPFHGRI